MFKVNIKRKYIKITKDKEILTYTEYGLKYHLYYASELRYYLKVKHTSRTVLERVIVLFDIEYYVINKVYMQKSFKF
jgi:hypothetical protein